MKSITVFIIAVLTIITGCRATRPSNIESMPSNTREAAAVDNYKKYSDPSSWILGYFGVSRLYQPPHSDWYISGKDGYVPEKEAIAKLRGLLKPDITIKIVLGTWCPDSRREVPRFMKIMDEIDFPAGNIQFIGVDNVKISPVENYESLDIQRVPTFIIYRNNIESGRIIENPVTSLEQDMTDILNRNEKQL